jgi:hypothetical protein
MRKLSILLLFSPIALGITFQTQAQSVEGDGEVKAESRWSVGLHAAPILVLDNLYSDYNGFSIQPGLYYNSGRFTLGAVPYYARLSDEYQGSLLKPADQRTRSITFVGMNLQARYHFTTTRLRPYALTYVGSGYVWDNLERDEEYGGDTEDGNVSLNFGLGAGASYQLNKTLLLDFRIEQGFLNNGDGDWYGFLLPAVGIIKRF